MADIIMAETMDVSEETYKFTIDLIDINSISFNIMNTNTGVKYYLNIKKEDEWFNKNSHKIQNDFSQLYHILNDCVDNNESEFKYDLLEEKDNINFKISMKNKIKFFKLDLEFNLERYISENGLTDDRLNSLEYRFNKLKEEFNKFKGNNIRINNNIIYDGIQGEYKIYNECNNLVYKGGMKNGKRDGEGVQYCPDSGQIIYSGNFKDGYYHGKGILKETSCRGVASCHHKKASFNKGLLNGHVEHYILHRNIEEFKQQDSESYNGFIYGDLYYHQKNGSRVETHIQKQHDKVTTKHTNIAILDNPYVINDNQNN